MLSRYFLNDFGVSDVFIIIEMDLGDWKVVILNLSEHQVLALYTDQQCSGRFYVIKVMASIVLHYKLMVFFIFNCFAN